MWEFDLFYLFRMMLVVFLTTYAALLTAATLWQLARILRGDDPRRRLLRVYLSYQLLAVRARPLAGELLQIAALAIILIILWRLHVR